MKLIINLLKQNLIIISNNKVIIIKKKISNNRMKFKIKKSIKLWKKKIFYNKKQINYLSNY